MSSTEATRSPSFEVKYPLSFAQIGKDKHKVDLCWGYISSKVFFESLAHFTNGDAPIFDSEKRVISKDERAVSYNPVNFIRSKVSRKWYSAFNPNYILSALEVASRNRMLVRQKKTPLTAEDESLFDETYGVELALKAAVTNMCTLEKYYDRKVMSMTLSNIQQTALNMFVNFPLFDNFVVWNFDLLKTALEEIAKWPPGTKAWFKRDEFGGEFVKVREKVSYKDELFVIEAVRSIVNTFTYMKALSEKKNCEKMEEAILCDWKKFKTYEQDLLNFINSQALLRLKDANPTVESNAWEDIAKKLQDPPKKISNASSFLEEIYEVKFEKDAKKNFATTLLQSPQFQNLEAGITSAAHTPRKKFKFDEHIAKEQEKIASKPAEIVKPPVTAVEVESQQLASPQEAIPPPIAVIAVESQQVTSPQGKKEESNPFKRDIQRRHSRTFENRQSMSLDLNTIREIFSKDEIENHFAVKDEELTQEKILFILNQEGSKDKIFAAILEKKRDYVNILVGLTGKPVLEREFSQKLLKFAPLEMVVKETKIDCTVNVNGKQDQFMVIDPDLTEKYEVEDPITYYQIIVLSEKTTVQTTIVQKIIDSEWDMPPEELPTETKVETEETLRYKINLINGLLRLDRKV
ncbi:MAG: hypothetical protein WC222_05120 [Parachlamydiales bacterium]|jgi:hypothetical protein